MTALSGVLIVSVLHTTCGKVGHLKVTTRPLFYLTSFFQTF